MIAFLAISFGSDEIYPKYALIVILCVFIRLQSIYQPFIIHEANHMEFNLLMCAILIVVIDISNYQELDDRLVYIILRFNHISIYFNILVDWRYHRKKDKNVADDEKYAVAWDSNHIGDGDE